jgi:ABC-2 type transport system ATP-binding protein
MNSSIALKVENVNKIYLQGSKHVEALKNISLEVKTGEIFGLLGPNGAGKSTFINILAGTVNKTNGFINVWGFDLDKNPRQVRASLGIVPQEINVDPFFSPKKILEIQAGLYGVKVQDRITDQILELTNLSDKANAYTRNLSGGMKRRLLVAKAMVHQPPILILDEPTAGVDVDLRRKLLESVRELNRQGVTIIYTTHYLKEASDICDRIAIIDRGKLVALNSTQELLKNNSDLEEVFINLTNKENEHNN